MALVKILYASMTGNNEDIADLLAENFEEQDFEVEVEDISMVDVADLQDTDICVVCPYTYEGGTLPDEGVDFFEDLADVDWSGKVFGVAGSGDDFYGDKFGAAVIKFDKQLAATKAIRGAAPLKINLAPDSSEDLANLEAFATSIGNTFNQA